LITVAIPTFNRIEHLRPALESALEQDYPSFEIIVHDDTQDDRIRSIVEGYGSDKVRYHPNRPPMGLLPKLNDFLHLAAGEWMVVLCDDDVLMPGYLAAIGAMAAARPDAALLRTRFQTIDGTGRVTREDAPCPFEMTGYEFASRIFDVRNRLLTMNITGVAFRPRALISMGGFRTFHHGLHTDCLAWFMLGSAGPSLCDPRPLCRIRQHAGSMTMNQDPDFEAVFQTHLLMHGEVNAVIKRLEAAARTADERRLARECHTVFGRYFSRWPAACDAAFEHALIHENKPFHKFRKIFGVMLTLNVPLYLRLFLYLLLVPLPIRSRKRMVEAFRRYRQRRIREYVERYGLGV
jgi:glycosyltransferase involved in cell wall biosynthesis